LRRLALRFSLSDPAVSLVIVGMRLKEEVNENVAAADLGPLSAAELAEVTAVVNGD